MVPLVETRLSDLPRMGSLQCVGIPDKRPNIHEAHCSDQG